jgi:hypothetical protein
MQLAAANPVRLVALVGVIALLGGGMLVFKTTTSGSSSESTPTLLHQSTGHHVTHPPQARTHGSAKPVHHGAHRPAAKPKPHPAVAANGLPWAVAHALAREKVVVVAVVTPRSHVDGLALAEAKAAAAKSQVGFVQVNAFQQSQIGPLASKLTVDSNPAILVLRRPMDVSIQISGFADRDSIVQAISDARVAAQTAP